MKVLIVSYLFPNRQYPNYGIFVLNRVKALQKYCELQVINPVPWFPFASHLPRYHRFDRIPRCETIHGIEVFHPRFPIIPKYLKSFDAISYGLAVLPLALRLQKEFPFDLIDLHWTYPDLPVGAVLSKITGRPFLTTLRGHEAFYLEEPGPRKTIVAHVLRYSAAIVALSQKLKDIAVLGGCDEGGVTVIRNGVDPATFQSIPQGQARKYLKIGSEERVLLMVGSLIQGKGIDRVIRALVAVRDKYPEIRLYLVGSEGAAGFYKKELLELVRGLCLQRHVIFVGEVENAALFYWYNAADLFCLASRREGSPNVLTEALCCGCPAIATDVGSVAEIMKESVLGLVMPNNDDILEGLLAGLQQTFDRKKIVQYMRTYDWDWCARQVVSVYHRVLER